MLAKIMSLLINNKRKREKIRKGRPVEHENKELIKELIPKNYNILGKVSAVVKEQQGKEITINEKFKYDNELSRGEIYLLSNIRDLYQRDGEENPYEDFSHIQAVDVSGYNDPDFKGTTMGISYRSKTKPKFTGYRTTYINLIIFEPLYTSVQAEDDGFGDFIEFDGFSEISPGEISEKAS